MFARGVEETVLLDEAAFEGTGSLVLGAVLERFFARYASINSFTETVIKSHGARRGYAVAGAAGHRHVI